MLFIIPIEFLYWLKKFYFDNSFINNYDYHSFIWTNEVEIVIGISTIAKVVNKLIIKEKNKLTKRVSESKILATKKVRFINYKTAGLKKKKERSREK